MVLRLNDHKFLFPTVFVSVYPTYVVIESVIPGKDIYGDDVKDGNKINCSLIFALSDVLGSHLCGFLRGAIIRDSERMKVSVNDYRDFINLVLKYETEYRASTHSLGNDKTSTDKGKKEPTQIKKDLDVNHKNPEKVTNEKGATQSYVPRFSLLPPHALTEMAVILTDGAKEYGAWSWHHIDAQEHIDHALCHLLSYISGDTQDKYHLQKALTRIAFACEINKLNEKGDK